MDLFSEALIDKDKNLNKAAKVLYEKNPSEYF